VLSITCDNASPNNTMVDALEVALPGFGGETNRTCCFDHIINLVARTVVRRFDLPKGEAGNDELSALAEGIDAEEEVTRLEMDDDLDLDDVEEINDWVADELGEDTEMPDDDEREEFEDRVRPVRLLLVKVMPCHTDSESHTLGTPQLNAFPQLRKLAYAILHSTTILLPTWFTLLKSLKMSERKMPRDVTTRWNSTYDMLVFALEYRTAIDQMCSAKVNGLRKYEMSAEEWMIAGQLRNVLKASLFFTLKTRIHSFL
jgi:hypothetical protein